MTKLNDGIVSANNSLGERSQARTYRKNRKLTDQVLSTLYEDNWIVGKFIDTKTRDMVRLDREIKNELEPKFDKAIEMFCKRFNVFTTLEDYLNWGRLYGDSIILAVTENVDGSEVNMQSMLDLDKERLTKFIVFDKTSYTPSAKIMDDVNSPIFGQPISYEINVGNGLTVNSSRVHRLTAGKKTTKTQLKGGKQSFGTSEVNRIWDALVAYDTAKIGISDMIEEAKVDVVKIKGYNQAMAEGHEENFIKLGLSMKTVKSLANVLMIDEDANWETKELASSWINESLKESRTDLAGACEMPLTRLFGQSAAGFASGEEDNKIYYEHINSKQESLLRPAWDFIDQFIIDDLKERFSDFDLSFFDYDFPSIRDRNEKEQAEIFQIIVNALVALHGAEAIDPVQIAKEIKLKGLMQSISDDDISKLESVVNDPTWTPANQENQGGFSF